ncbi:DUF6270 domain-containing protein [uncultured Clostridium sp.]|uniref:DUF6270 domain-containing protein n=1 Tax=uncultured Clostridium sp. TaxID=59620 RepID=UPI0026F3B34D|nr:DUF6270 domain-containing protein [uncultured Clostridium sp.]
MTVIINRIEFDYKSGKFDFQGKFNKKSESNRFAKLCFIERRIGAGNKIFNPKKVFFDIDVNEDEFFININLTNDYEFCKGVIWDAYIYIPNDEMYVRCEILESLKFKADFSKFKLINRYIKPYKTQNNKLSIHSKYLINDDDTVALKYDNNGCILFNNDILQKVNEPITLVARKRINGKLFSNFKENVIEILLLNKNYNISEAKITKDINDGDILDFFIVININTEYEEEYRLRIDKCFNDYRNYNEILSYKFYKTKKNTLACYFKGINRCEITSISIDNNNELLLNIKNSKLNFNYINMEKYITFYNSINNFYLREGIRVKSNSRIISNNILQMKLKLDDIINCNLENEVIIQLGFKSDLNENIINYCSMTCSDENLIEENNNYSVTLKRNIFHEAVFKIKKKMGVNKIAILGSCFSRLAFTSNEYFNLEYKNKYEVVYTQFYSSLISIMNSIKKDFNESLFSKLNEKSKRYVQNDFNKSFFENILLSKPDYLIIDFYIDSQKGIIQFVDGTIISVTPYIEISDFLYNLDYNDKVLCSSDIELYLPIWINAAQKFAQEIVKYIPEDKIIINYIKGTEKYRKVNGDIGEFSEHIEFIRKSNSMVQWMNEYMQRLLPKSQAIYSNKINCIGYEKHPFGNTSNHFESEYYKEFLNLLDKKIQK